MTVRLEHAFGAGENQIYHPPKCHLDQPCISPILVFQNPYSTPYPSHHQSLKHRSLCARSFLINSVHYPSSPNTLTTMQCSFHSNVQDKILSLPRRMRIAPREVVQTSTFRGGVGHVLIYWTRFRFRSSSRNSSSCSSSLSAVSAGFKICAMLPRLVGGPELSFSIPGGIPLLAPLHDQLLRWSAVLPLLNGGVLGRELSRRP
jgi:hypothetical protein